jgi:Tol biopolymer transport system component/tRNA A-37 threonylcarbamoyl transferase component Bud32
MPDRIAQLNEHLSGRYVIKRELGRGGMADVYLAHDERHDRQVAIKVLRPELAANLGTERLLREIQIAAKLTHPNILPVHDSGAADGTLYYVMPYIEGESLRDRLKSEKQLSLEDALQITREVADALGFAHGQGIVHRDIKPENILFAAGHAVVADFGIARAVTESGGESLTETGLTVGTPAYMSPEQATATQELDGRTDIYSLGCVLYEMLAGEVPYGGPTPMAVVAKKLSEPLPRVSVVREAIPPGVEAAVSKALARAPADRFKTAEQFVTALDAGPSRFVMPKRSVRLPVAAVVGAVLLAVGAFAAWKTTRPLTVTASNPRQVTFDPGLESEPAISPDGEDIAYGTDAGIYVQGVSGGTPQRLTERGGGPSWNLDGRSIFFTAGTGTGSTVAFQAVDRLGGPTRLVERHRGYVASISPDGTRQVGFERPSADTVEIYTYETGRSEESKQLLTRSGGWTGRQGPWGFAWSPDGRRIAYRDENGSPTEEWTASAIWVIFESGGDAIRVTDSEYRNTSPVWFPDNRHLLFVSDRDGPRDIYMVDTERPEEPQRVTFGGLNPRSMSLSADGKRLAFQKYRFRRNLWSVPIPADGTVSIGEGSPITAVGWDQLIMHHDLSPDGDTLVFTFRADPRGHFRIYKMPVGEWEHRSQLTNDAADDSHPAWSPNGREIVFGRWLGNGGDEVWVMDADGGYQRRVMEDPDYDAYCDWSEDGLQIICGRGNAGVWAVSRDSLRRGFDVPVEFGEPFRWSDRACSMLRRVKGGAGIVCNHRRDESHGFGHSLLWLSADGEVEDRFDATEAAEARRTWMAYVQGSAVGPEPALLWWMRLPRYSPDGSTVYFFGNPSARVHVMSMPAGGGDTQRVLAFDDPSVTPLIPGNPPMENVWASALTVGPDSFYISVGESESDIWVMDLEW